MVNLSNAFEKSRNKPQVICLLSVAEFKFSVYLITKIACSVE